MPTAREVLRYIDEKRLFMIPGVLAPFVTPDASAEEDDAAGEDDEELNLKTERRWLATGASSPDTHQGV